MRIPHVHSPVAYTCFAAYQNSMNCRCDAIYECDSGYDLEFAVKSKQKLMFRISMPHKANVSFS